MFTSHRVAVALAAAFLVFRGHAASATTYNWNMNSLNANWNFALHWSPFGIPGSGDTVNIGSFGDGVARTITYDYTGAPVTLNSLTIDLTGAGATTTTLSMSANNLTSIYEYVGNTGRGAFNQSGGTNTISAGAGYLDVGVFAGASGTYSLSGTGALVANTNEYVGDVGTGLINQVSGTNAIVGSNSLYLGYNASGASGTYTLSGGSLSVNAGSEYVGYNVAGTFNQSGGTNSINGNNFLYLGYNSGSNGT